MNAAHPILDSPPDRRALRPVVRWAGGKTALLDAITGLLPSGWGRYFEPMAGGCAVFFRLRPQRATLADINPDLINFYNVLKLEPVRFLNNLAALSATRELYYTMRRARPISSMKRAIRFAYLNRLAWNGLYRVNRNGHFNVPIGDRLPAILWDLEELRTASAALSDVTLLQGDFSHVLRYARAGDFVFLDPPYPRGAKDSGFNRYARSFFTPGEHLRLSRAVQRLTDRGVHLMLALADRNELRVLYPKTLRTKVVQSKSLIACNGMARGGVSELLMVNY